MQYQGEIISVRQELKIVDERVKTNIYHSRCEVMCHKVRRVEIDLY